MAGDLDRHLGWEVQGRVGRLALRIKPSDRCKEAPRGRGDNRIPLSVEFSKRLTVIVPTALALATCAVPRDTDAKAEGGVKGASLKGGWEYLWRNHCARMGRGR